MRGLPVTLTGRGGRGRARQDIMSGLAYGSGGCYTQNAMAFTSGTVAGASLLVQFLAQVGLLC